MRKPRVFISHSTPRDNQAQMDFLEEVRSAIDARGYEAQLDHKVLKPGDFWYQRLNALLAGCDAAVILLSRRAVTPPPDHPWWVRHESSVLTWRKSLQPTFRLVPALLEDVTLADLDSPEFAPLKLGEFQNFRPRTAQEIADALGAPVPPARTPLEEWVEQLAELLYRGREEDDALLGLAEAMGIPEPPQNPAIPPPKALAREIANRLMCQGLPLLFKHLRKVAWTLKDKTVRELLNTIASAWISPAAAKQLADASALVPPESAVINGEEIPSFTGARYARRAFWPEKMPIVFHSKGTLDQSLDELVESILLDVQNHPGVRQRTNPNAEEFLKKTLLPVFIILHVRVVAEDLATLQQRFPRATFVLSGGSEVDEADWARHPRLRVLRPHLDTSIEADARRHFDDCLTALATEP